ncbi:hypothetical protein Clacol_001295 [Clathrus columnatus]|uniref:Urease accessory protein UreF n=1 Tax=Clathrus columnatus TaxID=1419009 RepID=A0AAV4ZXZ7_9AGAM|nr:hypothetical protein Clacol_001295 [Clathrus columnatus]
MNDDLDNEQFILLLLSDGNLPTGAFVASSGLESYAKHGFPVNSSESVMDYVCYNLESYAHSALAFVNDTYDYISEALKNSSFEPCYEPILQLDGLYHAMTLNPVTRRASKAQGVALLTLLSKGFMPPNWMKAQQTDAQVLAFEFVDKLKLEIRRDATPGHLPICWGILSAILGLSKERSQHLHLFLYARGLLSSAIRMNLIGPYAAQQLLLYAVRPIVDLQLEKCRLKTSQNILRDSLDSASDGPINTWPLGEILAARHDLQHSKIFNS